jgi:chromosome segregation ATPase
MINYCGVCGKNHDGSACPMDKSPYDEAMDVIGRVKAALAEKDELLTELRDQIEVLISGIEKRDKQIADLEAVVEDDIRWMREMLQDYGIRYDDHSVGRRIALTTFIYGLKEHIVALEAEVEQWKRIIVTHVDVIAEKDKRADEIADKTFRMLERYEEQIAALQADVQKWIKIAGENQKSANQSAKWAEDAELRIRELTALDKSMCIRLDAANTEIVALQAEVEQWKRIIVTHVDVIAEKDKEIHELKMEMNRMVRY